MIIPIRHENMSARRWPVVTLTLIVLNVVIFVATNSRIEDQSAQLGQAKKQLLTYAATHPTLKLSGDAAKFVADFREHNGYLWKQLASEPPSDEAIGGQLLESVNPQQIEMDKLVREYETESQNSILDQYAFVPAHPKPISYLTANFLHGGWLHLIGNMWFLWLAGFVLEDAWGRVLYSVVYLVAGAAALQFYAFLSPGSLVPTLGASGAIAALMGAFLVRFPKMRIEMIAWFTFRPHRFSAPAYALLPLWLALEVFSGMLFGSSSGVAHWAHVGGFIFGIVAALGLHYTGLEQKANKDIEEKVGWQADPEIAHATELIDHMQYDEAIAALTNLVTAQPDSIDGWNLLQQAYWKKSDTPSYYGAMGNLCAAYLKQRQPEAAWEIYQEFLQAGGTKLPAATWLDLCRIAENGQDLDRARAEYEKLAAAYPDQRQGIMALIGAGRVCLKQQAPQDAMRCFEAAKTSKVPHLDLEDNIEGGLREAKKLLAAPPSAAAQHA